MLASCWYHTFVDQLVCDQSPAGVPLQTSKVTHWKTSNFVPSISDLPYLLPTRWPHYFASVFASSTASLLPDVMEHVVDFCTQKWSYGSEICIGAFALFHSARVRKLEKAGGKQLFWAESLILTYFMAFGGGILAPFLIGKPPVFFINDLLVPLVAFAWFLTNRAEGMVVGFLNIPIVRQVIMVLAECARANAMCTMVVIAMDTLKASKYYPIPLWGPILLGTIAGCGGLFLPLDKGLRGVKAGAPWPLQSAFYGSVFFHLMVHDPNVGEYIRAWGANALPGVSVPVAARVLVVLFFCSCALVQSFVGPSFNPFTPAHDLLYRVTGMSPPRALAQAAPRSREDKPKDD